jgi:hypothetical protein
VYEIISVSANNDYRRDVQVRNFMKNKKLDEKAV